MTDKIILFLVEGPTDEDTLALIFSKIVKEHDILKVIQIIDTDGAFIPSTLVKQSDTGKTEYFETHIMAKNKDRLIRRNSTDLTDEEKEDLAFEIADQYSKCPEEFLKLLYEADFHVSGTYKDTWEFIMKSANSLKRYCNMSVFFEKLGIVCKKKASENNPSEIPKTDQ